MYTIPRANVNRVSTGRNRKRIKVADLEFITIYGDLNGKPYRILKPTDWQLPRQAAGNCSAGLRKRVYAAFSCCQYCGAVDNPSIDRIIPGCDGGRYTADNVTRACANCNSKRQRGDIYGPVRPLSAMEGHNG